MCLLLVCQISEQELYWMVLNWQQFCKNRKKCKVRRELKRMVSWHLLVCEKATDNHLRLYVRFLPQQLTNTLWKPTRVVCIHCWNRQVQMSVNYRINFSAALRSACNLHCPTLQLHWPVWSTHEHLPNSVSQLCGSVPARKHWQATHCG